MRLRPRHYVLLLLILALALYNIYRVRHTRELATTTAPAHRGTSPAWTFFDKAADLRDASDDQFQPALQALNDAIDSSNAVSVPPQTSPGEAGDLHGCKTWLLFYRQAFLHPAADKPGFREQTQLHVLSCKANHRDALS
jgi:hypothetical protein